MGDFQKLRVWQLARDLAVKVYRVTQENKFQKDFGFKDQIQRSAVSIPSNISEGDELGSDKQSVKYFHIARGSAAELLTQLIIAREIGYITSNEAADMENRCKIISAMLKKLISTRDK